MKVMVNPKSGERWFRRGVLWYGPSPNGRGGRGGGGAGRGSPGDCLDKIIFDSSSRPSKEEDFSPIGFVVRKSTDLLFDFGWCPSRLAYPTAEALAAGN